MYYSFKNNVLEYKEIKKLLSVKPKQELIECVVTKGLIGQEYAVDYDVNYYRVNYRRCEKLQEIDYIKCNESSDYTIDYEEIKCFELVNDEKVEYCTIIEDQKVESYELIEEKYVEIIKSCKLIEDKEDNNQLIEDKIVQNDVHQLIKEINELIEDQEDINELYEYLEIIFNKIVKITFNESPFKSLISDIRSILPKDGCKKLKKHLKYIRELRKSRT